MKLEPIKQHVKAMHSVTRTEAPPWARMMICGVACGAPLMTGYLNGSLSSAIYGALLGYLLAQNDHSGSLVHRLLIAGLSFVSYLSCFGLGIVLREHLALFIALVGCFIYFLGMMGGYGAELERMVLFSIVQLIMGFYAPSVHLGQFPEIFLYASLALAVVWTGRISADRILGSENLPYAKLKTSLLSSLTRDKKRHYYAISYTLAALISIGVVTEFEIPRGYWTIVTVLLVMKPDHRESVYRSFQRFIGTVLGVMVGEGFLNLIHREEILILAVSLAAFAVPYAVKRNYAMVSFFVSLVVIFLLNIPHLGHPDTLIPFVRLKATLYGCGLSLFGVLIYATLCRVLIKK